MKLRHIKIVNRLALSFGAMLLMLSVMAGIGYTRLQGVGQLNNYMVKDVLAKQRLIAQWFGATNADGYRSLALFRATDPEQQKALEEKIKTAGAGISELQKSLDALPKSPEETALFAEVEAKRTAFQTARQAVIKELKDGNAAEVNKLIDASFQPAQIAYLSSFNKLIDFQDEQVDQSSAEIESKFRSGQTFILIVAGIGIALGILLAYTIGRSIILPLRRAMKISKTVARGDLTSVIEIRGTNELSELLWSLKSMNEGLASIVGEVRSGSDVIASASRQIASGNLDLSSRTEQQASALEETASATEQLTSTVRQNGDNAKQANQLATSASEVAIKGGQVVSQVVETMGSINQSAKKIVDIIGVIDGIAFQTNILALNAAVEAARAGEQGRGFAVVATEVRNLAQRSAAAAKEIKALIGDSVEKVDLGAQLVDQAGATMHEIVESVRKVTDIIGEITVASQEQLAGIESISSAINRMDRMTQDNASLVQESLAAAQDLELHATASASLVHTFKLAGDAERQDGDGPVPPTDTAPEGRPAPTLALAVAGRSAY